MKIGILTFQDSCNYGALLQAFALQEFLKSRGHNVEIIDYRSSHRKGIWSVLPIRRIMRHLFRRARPLRKSFVLPSARKNPPQQKNLRWFINRMGGIIPRVLWYIARRRAFKNFISKKLNLSRERFSDGCVTTQKYDAIVFGSDQIWNPDNTGGDLVFLGDIAVPEKTLKIAYAASAGKASKAVAKIPTFINALKNFDAISVREQDLADALKQSLEREIKVVLDPTLLIEKAVWDKIAVSPKAKRKYVLVYQMLYTPAANRIARELAEQIGADVVSIGTTDADKRRGDLVGETPEQFVGWVKDATCVVTTSFHGTAFSLIYERPLYYVSTGNLAENRPRQILCELGLLDRIVGEDSHPKFSEIDYSNSKARLEDSREESRSFLKTTLSSIT